MALGCHPDIEGKTLLLKTPRTLDRGLGRNGAGTDLEVVPLRINSQYQKELCKLPREKSSQQSDPAVAPVNININDQDDKAS